MESAPIGEFLFSGCGDEVQIHDDIIDNGVGVSVVPLQMVAQNMMVVEHVAAYKHDDKLYLPVKDGEWKYDNAVLDTTPNVFSLLLPHQDVQFASERPFFYQDDRRTFFVVPSDVKVDPESFVLGDAVDLAVLLFL